MSIQLISEPASASSTVAAGPVNVWYIPDTHILIDAGYEDDTNWLKDVAHANALLVTHHHPDHDGGVIAFANKFPEATIFLPIPDRFPALSPSAIQNPLTAPLPADLQAIDTPGHAAPHVAYWQSERGELYTGDLVLGEGTSWVGPPEGNIGVFLQSVEQLTSLDANTIYPGHGNACGPEQIAWTLDHRQARLLQIVMALQEPLQPGELVQKLYIDGEGLQFNDAQRFAAELTMVSYLDYLVDTEQVIQSGQTYERSQA